jgi:hypothetical protein
VKLAGHEIHSVASTNGLPIIFSGFKQTLALKEKDFMLFFMVMERAVAPGRKFHQPYGISRAAIIGGKKITGLHAGKTRVNYWDSGYIG